ncbi:MAG: S8 family serine peptidase, partial [Verrucomicrobiales bacterium]|nr:S8 family serine peptidase [Verrucomicrobiales bacterium]
MSPIPHSPLPNPRRSPFLPCSSPPLRERCTVLAAALGFMLFNALAAAPTEDSGLIPAKSPNDRRMTGDFSPILTSQTPASRAPYRQPALDGLAAAQTFPSGSNRVGSVLPATGEIALVLQPGTPATALATLAAQRLPVQALSPGAFGRIGGGREVLLLRSTRPGQAPNAESLLQLDGVLATKPVHFDPISRLRLVATDELIVRLRPTAAVSNLLADFRASGVQVEGTLGHERLRCLRLRLLNPLEDAFAVSRRLNNLPDLEWATPNFIREVRRTFVPNEPLFHQLQHLRNTGQQGAIAGADVGAVDAWDSTRGTNKVVIAILDDGVDLAHPDLKIRLNPGESGGGKETNGVDDDSNGFIDDYRGWDFANADNNPEAAGANGHGTACAGIAAATLNNGSGIAGLAGECTILPVKILDDTGDLTTDANIGAAFSFAALQSHVISCSWDLGASSAFVDTALQDAATLGRNGLGCPVFASAGNQASGWQRILVPVGQDLGPGTYAFGFVFDKDGSTSLGEDVGRLDNVVLLDGDGYTHLPTALGPGGRQDFEGTFPPPGWNLSTSGSALWVSTTNGAFRGTLGTRSAQSGLIGHGQFTELRTPNLTLAGDERLMAQLYVSSELGFDGLIVRVYDGSGVVLGDYGLQSGVPQLINGVAYPALHPDAIAIGASTDSDVRAEYSQSGPELDLVAPSDGGWNMITTLDPSGPVGSTSTDLVTDFGGTSAATPLAAGAGALLLTVNTNLTATLVRDILRASADKIGPVTYVGGFHPQYGYGRLNVRVAMEEVDIPAITVAATDASAAEPNNPGTFTITRSGQLNKTLTVNFTVSGTAASGTDYTAVGTSVTFAIGSSTTNLSILPIDDNVVESTKTVILNLAQGAGYTVGSPNSATVNLADNDSTVTVTASDATAAEPANLGTLLFSRSAPLTSALTVQFTLSGTATSGADYQVASTNVTFPANSGTVSLTITPVDDALAEGPETVVVTLAPGTGYAIGSPSSATVTLNDNDPPTITVVASDPDAGEPSDPGRFTLQRTGPTTTTLTATFVISGNATPGSDYSTLPSSITFATGAATTNITVNPIDDAAIEDPETILLTLTSSIGYIVGSPNSAIITLADDDTPFVSVNVTDNTGSEPGANTAAFAVVRAGSTLNPLTVNLLVSGSASSGVDFSPIPATVLIPAGATSAPVLVSPL